MAGDSWKLVSVEEWNGSTDFRVEVEGPSGITTSAKTPPWEARC